MPLERGPDEVARLPAILDDPSAHPEKRQAMSAAARELAETFTWPALGRAYAAWLRELLDRR